MQKIHSKRLLLIDGIGAIVSTIFLGIILVALREYIGLSKEVLYLLALPAFFFAIYSFSCYFFLKKNWSKYLKIIAILNLLYAFTTIILMFIHCQEMKPLGFAYFINELIIIFVLVRLEFKVSFETNDYKA